MQEAIREGTLRLLTSETSCDVILSCGSHKLMAHRVMLSIASPVLQVNKKLTFSQYMIKQDVDK